MAAGAAIVVPVLARDVRANTAPQDVKREGRQIDRAAYLAYIQAFNARDMEGFTKFYAPDVKFILGGTMQLVGRPAIVEWYTHAWEKIEEHCEVRRIILDETGIATELETTFRAIADWPNFTAGPLKAGDTLRRIGFIHYDIGEGYFTRIATAPHRVLQRPEQWLR